MVQIKNTEVTKNTQVTGYTKEIDFIIGLRWIDKDSFNSFDQTVFTLNGDQLNQNQTPIIIAK